MPSSNEEEVRQRIATGYYKQDKRKIALAELQGYADEGDTERFHALADTVLIEVLKLDGRHDIVAAWEKLDKWYA